MLNTFAISAVNPALLWGALAVASPIIIHLLSKRRFKIIEWAAMDFLIEADKRNRRRVRLEQLILLLLRCLACILIALLVSRPFFQEQGMASFALSASGFERIVVLDDSPSMALQADGKITFDETKKGLTEFVRELGRERARDTFTLRLTSRPDTPIVNGLNLTSDNIEEIVQKIENTQVSDMAAQLEKALVAVDKALDDKSGPTNHVLYLITDMRKRDWAEALAKVDDAEKKDGKDAKAPAGESADAGKEQDVVGLIKRISDKTGEVVIVDVGAEGGENLTVTEIRSRNKSLVKGVDADFQVVVRNYGSAAASDVEVVFAAGESVELKNRVENIGPGEEAVVPFSYKFEETGAVPITATIPADALRSDNSRLFAARVREGVQVLLVNGDPSSDRERSEIYFLEGALKPSKRVRLGFATEEVSENLFEGLDLSRFQVIFLCNVYRVSEERAAALDRWVKAGGGLIITLGNQVDDVIYNQLLYKEGAGLLPARIEGARGDETEKVWAGLNVDDATHPVIGQFADPGSSIGEVKVFRWHHTFIEKKATESGKVSVPLRLTDADTAPAIVEQKYGSGRVMLLTTSADGDWNTWPADGSYVLMMLAYSDYAARNTIGEGALATGTPIRHELDAGRFQRSARIVARIPGAAEPEAASRDAVPADDGKREFIEYEETHKAGFYQLELSTHDGKTEPVLFAANIDAGEGQLVKVPEADLKKKLGDAKVTILTGKASLASGATGARSEIWPTVLLLLVGVLCAEQFLAWTFGRRR